MAELREKFLHPTDAIVILDGNAIIGTGSRHARAALKDTKTARYPALRARIGQSKEIEQSKTLSTNSIFAKIALAFNRTGLSKVRDFAKPQEERANGDHASAPAGKIGAGAMSKAPSAVSKLRKLDLWSRSSRPRSDADAIWEQIDKRVSEKLERLEVEHPAIAAKINDNEELSADELKIVTGAVEIGKSSQP